MQIVKISISQSADRVVLRILDGVILAIIQRETE